MERKLRLSKVISYLKAKNNIKTQKDFAKSLDFSETSLSSAKKGNDKYLTDSLLNRIAARYPEINLNWLLTGEGEMLIGNESPRYYKQDTSLLLERDNANSSVSEGVGADVIMVPILNLDARGGFAGNDVADTAECFIGQMPFSKGMALQGDIVMPIYGDSMAPKYPSGSYVLIRPIEMWREYLEFGHTYVLGLSDGRRLLKTVQRGTAEGTFALLSFNEGYPTQDIPTSIITAVFRVIAMVRQDGM